MSRVAYHEAGHAVAAVMLGIRVDRVTLKETTTTPLLTPAEDLAVFLAAGGASEELFCHGKAQLDAGDRDELEQEYWRACKSNFRPWAHGHDAGLGASGFISYAAMKAFKLLAPHKAVIRRVALELENRLSLSGDQVKALVAGKSLAASKPQPRPVVRKASAAAPAAKSLTATAIPARVREIARAEGLGTDLVPMPTVPGVFIPRGWLK